MLPLIGGGHTRLQPVYVGDIAAAIKRSLDIPAGSVDDPRGVTYDLGGPEIMDFRRIYQELFKATGQKRRLLPIPFWAAKADGMLLSLLPNPPLTMDQVESLKSDAIAAEGAPGLAALGVQPTALEDILPDYLARFRTGGRFRMLEKTER